MYRLVLAVQRAKTLRGAAVQLGVNHSTVSRKLAWLNSTYSQLVFEKTPTGYRITDFGQHLVDAAEKIEAITLSAERMNRARNSSLAGRVRLSVSIPIMRYLLADHLSGFVQQYPNIELVLHASERVVDLDQSEADVVIRSSQSPPDHLVGRRLFPYAVCYYAHRDYLAATPPEKRCWIGQETDDQFPEWLTASPYPELPVVLRASGYEIRHQALLAGLGMARGACFMADQEPDLVRLSGTEPFPGLDFWVLTHPDLRTSPRIKVVMRFLAEVLIAQKTRILGDIGSR